MRIEAVDREPMPGPRKARTPGVFLRRSRRSALVACIGLAAAGSGPSEAAQCGTARFFELQAKQPPGPRGFSLRVGAAPDLRARTLESEHFLFHYSLRAPHRVHLEPEDAPLANAADSLYAVFAALTDPKRDSAVYARLDAAQLPHPVYIRKMEEFFESAWAYYVGTLGMLAPEPEVLSRQYQVSPSLDRKFPVDVVDVGAADPKNGGETYGLTYPPSEGFSITFENDFICCHSSRDPDGESIKSRLSGQVIHDYGTEWDLGIKVTAFHELYHAIQFTYVPSTAGYHAWYELSATGMEERKAGEVDDYLQYLPCVLQNHATLPLNAISRGPCAHYPMYGNSIFFQFLGHALDSVFDVRVWEQLQRNGDVLQNGLETAFAAYGGSMAKLYPGYAAQLFFTGPRFHPPDSLFSPDMARWPELALDSVDLSASVAQKRITLPALTFGILKVKWGAGAEIRILRTTGAAGISRIHADAERSEVESLQSTQLALGPPHAGFQAYYLVIPNPSFTEKAVIEVRDPGSVFYPFPNPVHASSQGALYFSPAKGMAYPFQVRIYSEAGLLMRSLTFGDAERMLSWDLKDERGTAVAPGVYYYRLGGEPLKILIVLR